MQIRDLLKRDLSQKIEEVIQLDQADEHAVYDEITEYVATDSIKRQYNDLLEAINLSRTQPTSGVGVWISGFFGSGKSSFAKNLGYVLANPEVLGQPRRRSLQGAGGRPEPERPHRRHQPQHARRGRDVRRAEGQGAGRPRLLEHLALRLPRAAAPPRLRGGLRPRGARDQPGGRGQAGGVRRAVRPQVRRGEPAGGVDQTGPQRGAGVEPRRRRPERDGPADLSRASNPSPRASCRTASRSRPGCWWIALSS